MSEGVSTVWLFLLCHSIVRKTHDFFPTAELCSSGRNHRLLFLSQHCGPTGRTLVL